MKPGSGYFAMAQTDIQTDMATIWLTWPREWKIKPVFPLSSIHFMKQVGHDLVINTLDSPNLGPSSTGHCPLLRIKWSFCFISIRSAVNQSHCWRVDTSQLHLLRHQPATSPMPSASYISYTTSQLHLLHHQPVTSPTPPLCVLHFTVYAIHHYSV